MPEQGECERSVRTRSFDREMGISMADARVGEVRFCGAESLALAIAISLKSAVSLSDAKYFGRLALPTLYDNVAYFNDALTCVNHIKANGMGSVVRGFASSSPHSPYSTVTLRRFLDLWEQSSGSERHE